MRPSKFRLGICFKVRRDQSLRLITFTEKNIELTNFLLPSQQNFSFSSKRFVKQKAITNSFVGSTNRFVGKKNVLSVLYQQSGWLMQ